MSTARAHLLSRVEAIQAVLSNSISVDILPVPGPSSPAVVVRNGCLVMLFNALEDFIRARAVECTTKLNRNSVPYSNLPEKLKMAALVSTFEGLLNITKGWPNLDKLNEFEDAAKLVSAGPLGSQYQFSEFSFGREKSNLNGDDVSSIAARFGVKAFWNEATRLRGLLGSGAPQDLHQDFKNLARARHKAAHVPSHIIGHVELDSALKVTVDVAIGFDMLVSKAVDLLNNANLPGGGNASDVKSTDLKYVFLRPHSRGWAMVTSNARNQRARFVEADFTAAQSRVAIFAGQNAVDVVIQDASRRVTAWQTCIG